MNAPKGNNNREIATRIKEGDRVAESELVEIHSQGLFHLLLRLTRNRAMSEDLHQETFIIVIARLRQRTLDEPDKLGQFIYRIGRNLALGQRRKCLRQGELTAPQEDLLGPAEGPLEQMLSHEQAEILHRLLSDVSPDRYQQVLRRFYVLGEDKSKICSDLGVTELHFNCLLFRARQRLKELAEGVKLSAPGRCNRSLPGGRYQDEEPDK